MDKKTMIRVEAGGCRSGPACLIQVAPFGRPDWPKPNRFRGGLSSKKLVALVFGLHAAVPEEAMPYHA